jgi:processive 1,2-diacylglycerol beta-glucosyltransferase/1,2-diacylglycerol 3-beta-galactosyltransferase
MTQRIAFLYLNTGGGHIAPARALARAIDERYGGTSQSFLVNGFSERMRACRFFIENGYSITANFFEPGYVLFYQLTGTRLAVRFGNYFISLNGVRHLAESFKKHGITKVVCLHEVLIMPARAAIDRVNPAIPLITLVTDPFTAHPVWFHEKRMELVVFSEKLRREAIERYGYDPARVHAFPFILSRAYERPYAPEEVAAARARRGIGPDEKVILIAGGGEGLKSADRIVAEFLRRRRTETLVVVCGRNRILRRLISLLVERAGARNVRVLGFVDYMSDLINMADCVITKGGASTVMEILALGKPIVFSTYIRGQELGNMLFAVTNGAGWYLKRPREIVERAVLVANDPEVSRAARDAVARLGIRNGLDEVARFAHDFGLPADERLP